MSTVVLIPQKPTYTWGCWIVRLAALLRDGFDQEALL